jgi:peptidoglycan/xylan/chitin deacetylase (PgdA/CDA1 family)
LKAASSLVFTNNALRWLETILNERFGHRFDLSQQSNTLLLRFPGNQGEIKFDQLQEVFHQSRSEFPCQQWQASSESYTAPIENKLPAPSETDLLSPLVELNGNTATIHYDILGLAYWMLTRLEEVDRTDLDSHQRFPATSSHAYKHDYLERPIVDEWLIILGQVIQSVWPQLKLKQHKFSIKVSHDVDRPSRYGFRSFKPLIRAMAGDVLKNKNIKGALIAPWVRLNTRQQLHRADPFNTFDWLMDVSEANNLKSAFYFICGRTHPMKDADYEPEHPAIRNLMRRIHERGHEIGLHPSYSTFQKPELIKQEADRLKRICAEEGIQQSQWGGRMHYLRWEQPTTLRAWADADMTYDSTLGYADRPGFRCGTCHEYPAFDPIAQEPLSLRIRPLIVMEGTIISPQYLGLGQTKAFRKITKLKKYCEKMNGQFTLLWHNSEFLFDENRDTYSEILK